MSKYRITKEPGVDVWYVQYRFLYIWLTVSYSTELSTYPVKFSSLRNAKTYIQEKLDEEQYPIYYP